MTRQAAKVDRNQTEIIQALRKAGKGQLTVYSLAGIGNGIPDLICGVNGKTYLVEVKDGSKARSAQKLTPMQEQFCATWTGRPVMILRDTDTAHAWAVALTQGKDTDE